MLSQYGPELLIEPVSPTLVSRITGRDRSLFHDDLEQSRNAIEGIVAASRILVIGAAGSIGSALVRYLLRFDPAALTLVDLNENGLADLVRTLRSGPYRVPAKFTTSVVSFGSHGFARFIAVAGPFDVIFNFAALKHVRTERDPFSLARMIETNVFAVDDLLHSITDRNTRLFSVSSDKAVYPQSLMGATKRWMERVLSE